MSTALPHVCGKRIKLLKSGPMLSYVVQFGCITATLFRLRDGQWRWAIVLTRFPQTPLTADGQLGSHWPCASLERAAEEVSLVLHVLRASLDGLPSVKKPRKKLRVRKRNG